METVSEYILGFIPIDRHEYCLKRCICSLSGEYALSFNKRKKRIFVAAQFNISSILHILISGSCLMQLLCSETITKHQKTLSVRRESLFSFFGAQYAH